MVTGAMLASISAVLFYFDFPLFFLPSFYKFDFSCVPVLIGSYAMGPVAGVILEAFKILIKYLLKGTSTAGVGELAKFIIDLSFILPAAVIYQIRKTKKSAIIGLVIASICCVISGSLLNAFVLIPAYAQAFGGMERVIGSAAKTNSNITGVTSLVLLGALPLNLLMSVSNSIIVILIYKPISRIIKAFHNNEEKKADKQ